MTHFIWQTYSQTPTWIWGTLLLMIFIAIQATRPIIIPVHRLLYAPTLFCTLAALVIYYSITLTRLNILALICTILIGCFIGYYQMRFLRIRGIRNTYSIYIPGNLTLLFLCIGLIASKFYLNYRLSFLTVNLLKNPIYALLFIGIYGLFSGMFLGRILQAFYCIMFGPFVEYEDVNMTKAWRSHE